jgi:hypothetical protein
VRKGLVHVAALTHVTFLASCACDDAPVMQLVRRIFYLFSEARKPPRSNLSHCSSSENFTDITLEVTYFEALKPITVRNSKLVKYIKYSNM